MPSLRSSASSAPRTPLASAASAALITVGGEREDSTSPPPRTDDGSSGHSLDRSSAHAAIALLALGLGGALTTRNRGWLGHVGDTILRPSVQWFPGEPVSRDVGTEGLRDQHRSLHVFGRSHDRGRCAEPSAGLPSVVLALSRGSRSIRRATRYCWRASLEALGVPRFGWWTDPWTRSWSRHRWSCASAP